MRVVIELLEGPHRGQPTQEGIQGNIDALNRAKPAHAADEISILDTISILETIKKQLPSVRRRRRF